MVEKISISLMDDLPHLDISISCYTSYKDQKDDELSYELMRLAAKGYKDGEGLVNLLLRGFAEGYRKEFFKEDFPSKVYKTLKEGFEAMAVASSFEIETNKMKIRIPYPSLAFLGAIASKLKLPKWGQPLKEETVELDGQELRKINEVMEKDFKVAMNSYFTYLLKPEFIPMVMNNEEESSKFHDRYLTILNEIDEVSNLQFVKWLFPDHYDLWDKVYE